jgi:hypothetical protein
VKNFILASILLLTQPLAFGQGDLPSAERVSLWTNHAPIGGGDHGLNGYKGPMWDAWQTQSLEWLAAGKFIPAADVVVTE